MTETIEDDRPIKTILRRNHPINPQNLKLNLLKIKRRETYKRNHKKGKTKT
jgi:hypothetical protein